MKTVRKKKNSKLEGDSESLILKAYIELCFEIGVANITLQKLADRAGVAFGTVRYYFAAEKKQIHDEAFRVVLASAYVRIDKSFQEARKKADFDPVRAYVETMFSWIRESPPEASFLIYLYYLSSTNVEVATPIKETVENARLRLEGLIHEAVGKGLYAPVNDSLKCAAMIHACVVGMGFIALSYKEAKLFNQQQAHCLNAVEAIVRHAAR